MSASRLPRAPRRVWVFRALSAIGVPLLLILVLELGLRIGGFGYPTRFAVRTWMGEQPVHVENPSFTRRFFSGRVTRRPYPFAVPRRKAPGELRVVVLGESAAQGDPDPSFGLPRLLQVLLQEHYPNRDVTVVNAAVTGINSHAIRDLADDCVALAPDLFVVYMGNNEVVGPFGPGSVFGLAESNLGLIRASLFLKRMRIAQVLESLLAQLPLGDARPSEWQGMRMFVNRQVPADDPRLESMYHHFERNLRDICLTAHRRDVPLVLCTVGSNLRDCPPFASLPPQALGDAGKESWEAHCASGKELEAGGKSLDALEQYHQASILCPSVAELRYRMARCQRKTGRYEEARAHYIAARDLDALRFRADTRVNEIIGRVARELADRGVVLADAVAAFELDSGDRIPGEQLFWDHVHLTFRGNYVLARCAMAGVERVLTASSVDVSSRTPDATPTEEHCRRVLAYTPWHELAITREMLARVRKPPFPSQLDHAARIASLETRIQVLQRSTDDSSLRRQIQVHRQAIEANPGDWQLRDNCARVLEAAGQIEAACAQLREALEVIPHHADARAHLADLLAAAGQSEEAHEEYRRALSSHPDSPRVGYAYAMFLESQGATREAVRHYRAVARAAPDDAGIRSRLAAALAHLGRDREAQQEYETVLQGDPNCAPAHNGLGLLLMRKGALAEAAERFRSALAADASFAEAHNNLGLTLVKLGNLDDAIAHFSTALRIRPSFPEALENLRQAAARKRLQVDEHHLQDRSERD